jgi:hypothetical protein
MMYDDVIMRTIIDLTTEQADALAKLCQAEGISRAEAVRRALDAMLAGKHLEGKDRAFGAWRPRGDSRKVVEKLRKEWDR